MVKPDHLVFHFRDSKSSAFHCLHKHEICKITLSIGNVHDAISQAAIRHFDLDFVTQFTLQQRTC